MSDQTYINDDGKTVLKLSTPIQKPGKEGELVEELTFRRPVTADLAAMDEAKGDIAKAQKLISQVCEVSMAVVGRMDVYDFVKAQEITSNFLLTPPSTGGTS